MSVEPLNALVSAFVRHKPKGIVDGFERYVREEMKPYDVVKLFSSEDYRYVYADWIEAYADNNPGLIAKYTGWTKVENPEGQRVWVKDGMTLDDRGLADELSGHDCPEMKADFAENFNEYGEWPSVEYLQQEEVYDDAMTVWLNGLMRANPEFFERAVRECFPEGVL